MGRDWTTYYSIDRDWSAGLRELIARYGTLRTVPQGAEHRRGQQFNALVADVLRQWRIDAEANVRGVEGRDRCWC